MKITDYMQNAMNILRAEFDYRGSMGQDQPGNLDEIWDDTVVRSHRPWPGGYVDRPIYTLGVEVNDFLVMAGAQKASGANTMALVFDDGVIKWSGRDGLESHYTTDEDASFYQDLVERLPKYRKYLAETIQVGMFTVQELIRPAGWDGLRPAGEVINDLNDDERFDVYATLIRVAYDMGIRDVHMGNWGFRGDDLSTPVIFDFSSRRAPGSVMTWERLNPQFNWSDWNVAADYNSHLQGMLNDLNDFAEVDDRDEEY
jgi:hypothetical protein